MAKLARKHAFPRLRRLAPLAAAHALAWGCGSGSGAREAAAVGAGEGVGAGAGVACAEPDEAALVQAVNHVRAAAGARPFGCHARLRAAAANHAAYLALNDAAPPLDRHAEDAAAPLFTGATPAERAAHAGLERADFWLSEGVGGSGAPAEVAAAHVATVYHRSPLLTPAGRYAAFAVQVGATRGAPHPVIETLADGLEPAVAALAPALHPGRGEAGLPARFGAAREAPDPVPDLAAPGYPVSVHFPRYLSRAGEEPRLVVDAFTLTDAGGRGVPARLLTAASDARVFGSDAYLVPLAPLAAGATYVAAARMTYGRFRLDETWSFTTRYNE